MAAYRRIVVGTDGSDTSLNAVVKAGEIASAARTELVIACAYEPVPARRVRSTADVLKNESYLVRGSAPTEELLRSARELAKRAGASIVDTRAVIGEPVGVLLAVAASGPAADLIVVGNKGVNTLSGRWLGSVATELAQKAPCDVMVVHTTG
ncbi:universal stress protein [Nocardia sp. NPDC020380]|uniref:universal stress protein n=1 Tax=Nocardia sp. NPDC020380 TaxID=3364309 RepID=UPI0037B5DDFF